MNIRKIKKLLAKSKNKLKKLFRVKEIGIFGSYVRGEQKKKSDLDILVEYEEVPGLLKFIALENYLTDLMRIKVDLVRKQALREELRDIILREVVYV